MSNFDIYLELSAEGRCMAHAPALPGCMMRANSQKEALRQLPAAIHAYYAWLRQHGEPSPEPENISLNVVETARGYGPFDPSDKAALFADDHRPLAQPEMEAVYFRRAAYSRADLLALVRGLPPAVMNWKAPTEEMTIRRLLRHVGNAEEWYVSRLVEPETLPAKWEHDAAMPTFQFLAMERRTALARLRRLTDEEVARVNVPAHRTSHPDEAWTARKALRRLLEHEREHTEHIRQLIGAWRRHLMARLAAERSALFHALLGLDRETLTRPFVFEDYTAAEVLAHVAAWDELFTERIRLILEGRAAEIVGVDLDGRNAALHEEQRHWPLEQCVAACEQARAAFQAALSRVPEDLFHHEVTMPWGRKRAIRTWTRYRHAHDGDHAVHFLKFRKRVVGLPLDKVMEGAGPKCVLLAAVRAAFEEWATLSALLPADDRDRWLVYSGRWTMKDVLGHLADWNWLAVEGLRARQATPMGFGGEVETWNQVHIVNRYGDPWKLVWGDFTAGLEAMIAALEAYAEEELAGPFPNPWGSENTPYRWAVARLDHMREHAAGLRSAMRLSGYPKRLLSRDEG